MSSSTGNGWKRWHVRIEVVERRLKAGSALLRRVSVSAKSKWTDLQATHLRAPSDARGAMHSLEVGYRADTCPLVAASLRFRDSPQPRQMQ